MITQAKIAALLELEALAKTKKWVASGEVSKEAAWGRAYEAALRELLAKYRSEAP